ncbi:MAG: SAM-dependent methyltransferase [Pseudonocardiales bacterium]
MNQEPGEIDFSVPHSARVYDYWLGGKDNCPADRAMAEAVIAQMPSILTTVRANRAFLGRAVRYLTAEAGIRQFLDIGTGLPTFGNVHEVAQQLAPESRVVYCDYDPIVLTHAQALLTSHPDGKTAFIQADLREPEGILSDPTLKATLGCNQPVALILVGVLMFLTDSNDPYGTVKQLLDAFPSGSYLVITHLTADFDPVAVAGNVAVSEQSGISMQARSRDEVAAFFTGLELVEPGVVRGPQWRPDAGWPASPVTVDDAHLWAGVARKPRSRLGTVL